MRASRGKVQASPWLSALAKVLGSAPGTALPLGELRYERVILLFDPDADGIHAGALVQIFFLEYMHSLLEKGVVEIVHAPWGEVRRTNSEPKIAYHETEFQLLCRDGLGDGGNLGDRIRHRGLGTITPSILQRTCVNRLTRRSRVLSVADAEKAANVFGRSVLSKQ
jgi:DNA gyrase subunit B